EEGLEEGRAARHRARPLDVDERRRLVQAELRLRRLEAGEPGAEGLPLAPAHAHRERIDEEADHRLDAGELGRAAGDGGAEDDIRGAREAAEEDGPGPLRQGVQGETGAARRG